MKSFDLLWREMNQREQHEASSGLTSRKVRLACSGELVGLGSIGLIGLRRSAPGGELLEYVCPRCHQRHESLLLS